MSDFEVPGNIPELSAAANAVVQLGSLVSRLAIEQRTICYNPDGSPEDVAQHSAMLAEIAPILAEEFFVELGLDPGRIARFATIHDNVEAITGDTPTHEIDSAGLVAKAEREARALHKLAEQYSHLPSFVRLLQAYHAQEEPEARFVRVVDKIMPILTVFNDSGAGIRRDGITGVHLRGYAAAASARIRAEYPEFEAVIAIWLEITELVAARLDQ